MSPGLSRKIFGGLAVLFVGLLLLSHGCVRFIGGGGHVFGAEVVEGRIVAINSRPTYSGQRRRGTVYEATVEYAVDGRVLRVEDKTGFIASGRRVGSTLPVYYDPATPEKGLVGGTAPLSVTPYLFELVFGWLVVIAAALVMILAAVAAREKRKQLAKERR